MIQQQNDVQFENLSVEQDESLTDNLTLKASSLLRVSQLPNGVPFK